MQIEKDRVVTLNYTLKDDSGKVIDQSQNGEFVYLHGANNIIPGLESALAGQATGDKLSVQIAPEDAYGARDESKTQQVPREMFPQDVDIQVGMQFQAQGPDGQALMVIVAAVADDTITVDGNHPLAGVSLNFDVEVLEVRAATEEELTHGHAHGPEGHHQH